MNFGKLLDSRKCLPLEPGRYVWWSSYLGFIPVDWDGLNWRTLAGDIVISVIWWR